MHHRPASERATRRDHVNRPYSSPCASVLRLAATPRGNNPARGLCGPEKAAAPVKVGNERVVLLFQVKGGTTRRPGYR